jgi:DNA-binding response OmpR family regulator
MPSDYSHAMNDDSISEAPNLANVPIQGHSSRKHRILVVEDDADIRRLNADVLTSSGYQVDAAEDGAAAWAHLQLNGYDLLITDNEMPIVTGVELLKRLRAAHMALPVIMATGTLPEEEFQRYAWLHPDAMLRKPYTVDELVGTVREVLHANEQTPPPKNFSCGESKDDSKNFG